MDLKEALEWTITLSYMITFIKEMMELIPGERKIKFISLPSPTCVTLLRIFRYLSCSRALTFVLTIASGFMYEAEFERCSVALVLHAGACIVTTLVVFWNNQESLHSHSLKQRCEFWFMNFMCLTGTEPCNNKSKSNETTGDFPWYPNNYFNLSIFKLSSNPNNKQLEGKLKETYTRLCISFFTNVPSVILQSHFLFQSEARINEEGFHWLDVVRVVFVATTIIELTTTVTAYERYSHEYTLQLYKLDKDIRPRGRIPEPECFDFWETFRDQLLTFVHWIFLSATFLGISIYHVSIILSCVFVINHFTFELNPEVVKQYVNPPFGFHTVPSFWTMRIINTFSGVDTRLHKNALRNVFQIGYSGGGIRWYVLWLWLQLLPRRRMHTLASKLGADNGSFGFRMDFIRTPFNYQVMSLVILRAFKSRDELIRLFDANQHYPMLSGYAFYNTLFEHIWENSRDRLVSLRTLMVTSLVVPERVHTDMLRYHSRAMKDRELVVHSLREHFITELGVVPDLDSVIQQIEGIRTIKLEEEFPFVHEFDEIMSTILKNEDEEEKFKDLKLFCWFYDNFDRIVRYLMSDKIMMISEIMGLTEVRKRRMPIPFILSVWLSIYFVSSAVSIVISLYYIFPSFIQFEHLCG